ncbi:Uncharacterised protein [Mycobacteroides abscessus subsp. abscessus]|nr:Uncharacterised protein [Mycobacteroides abscessus subsp. abscessus]
MPLTIAPGTIQLARSPFIATCMPPSTATSTWPPRIIAKLVAESKNDAPGSVDTVCLPALIRSGSTSSSYGNGPTPRMPFSACRVIPESSGIWSGISVGSPMPRLT